MASGDLTHQELQMMVQLASRADEPAKSGRNCGSSSSSKGLALVRRTSRPDQGLVAALLIAGQAVQDMPTPQQPGVLPPRVWGSRSASTGPAYPRAGTGTSDSIPAENRTTAVRLV